MQPTKETRRVHITLSARNYALLQRLAAQKLHGTDPTSVATHFVVARLVALFEAEAAREAWPAKPEPRKRGRTS